MAKTDKYIWRVSITLSLLLLLAFPKSLWAEIKNPYLVDEKPRVLFGDSTEIITASSTHYGLENYQTSYVGNYLHISYTYSHHVCCYASNPPRVYVTNVDPRSTTTPIIKSQDTNYVLLTGDDTNWYSYDIQFDVTGYTVVVTKSDGTSFKTFREDIPNLADSDWVALGNWYPLTDGITPNAYSMSFIPLPLREGITLPTKIPVIIVPGIMGSKLINSDTSDLIWPNLIKLAFSSSDDFLNDLLMNTDGSSANSFIETGDILRKVSNADYFQALIGELDIYNEGINLFVFPYDWRKDIVALSFELKQRIDEVKSKTGSQKVNIIAHSMGGLLVKQYIKENGGNSINTFIDISTPHNGSPKSFKILNFGDDLSISYLLGIFSVNQERLKIISQNMPSVYELLPSSNYINQAGSYLYDLDDLDGNGERGALDFTQTKSFLKNSGRNSLLTDKADQFHNDLDNLDPRSYGVKAYNIVGCGTETLGKIFILNKELSGGIEYNISYVNGDGTVPLKSSLGMSADQTFYVKNAIHALMPSSSGVKELIASLLSGDNFDSSNYPNIQNSASNCNIPNGRIVSFHSPIALHIYDSNGNHTGPTSKGDIENNIPGVDYEVIDSNKFAYLPDGVSYEIKGKAEEGGSFNARIQKVVDENVTETDYFNNILVSSTTEVTVNSNSISIDNNSDGVIDSTLGPSSILNASQSLDITKPITQVLVEGKKKDKHDPFSKPVTISFIATDDNSGVLKTEYSLNNGLSWVKYLSPFTLSSKGDNKILYHSIDKAGNIESLKTIIITISKPDKTK